MLWPHFSEIRDYMLQQARQRADLHVGDVCHLTPRVSTHRHKGHNCGPNGHVDTDEQESEWCQNEQDQECDGGEVFAVKGKGKGGFKGTCFKCGMRGHKS